MNRAGTNGWAAFAATMLVIVGAVNLTQGFIAMLTPEFYLAEASEVLFLSFMTWGVGLALWGLIMLAAGFSLASGQTWARALGVVAAAVNVLGQLAFVAAYPWWSLAMVAMNVLVIYGLTAGWPATATGTAAASYESGRADARSRTAMPRQAREEHQQPM